MSTGTIRAIFDDTTIRVYQAFRPEIAGAAVKASRFVPPFRMGRMTWIKPSFNWMMYRCGYAQKESQECVLGIDITREGFEWALDHAALSHFVPGLHESHDAWKRSVENSSVRIQWDPERDWKIRPIEGVRSIQIGLAGEAVERYVNDWCVRIEDVTPMARQTAAVLRSDIPPEGHPSTRERAYLYSGPAARFAAE